MCGIAAIFAYHDSAPGVDPGELRSIRDCMKPRGPDGEGEWFDSSRRIGLGHRRLAIIDLSPGGAQPMLLPERQLAITFNGEIYNYRQLRAGLEKRGHSFRSASDTEVLLRLYAERGEAMVDELRGMYAFAIWDGARKGLFLARDPLGIKPLYYGDNGKTLRLASQVKALLAGGQVDTSPEPAGHVGFFLWGHAVEPYTFYRGIRSLPAGTSLWVDQTGTHRQKKFCSITSILAAAENELPSPPRSGRGQGEVSNSSPNSHLPSSVSGLPQGEVSNSSGRSLPAPCSLLPAENPSLLRASLVDTVRHHLVSDVPVGIFLSSGLDSTTLTALAADQGGTLRTVTLGFEEFRGTANDETPLAEAVARQYGASHQTVWVRRSDFQAHVDRLFSAMDSPSTDGVNTYFVSHAAAQTSLKVALSGLGGDELFGGYPGFSEIPRAVKMFQRFNSSMLQRFSRGFRVVSAPILKHFTSPKYAGLLEYGGSYGGAYLLRRGMFMPWELPEFLDPDFVRQGWAELQPLVRLDETIAGIRNPRAKVACLEMCWYMRNQLLRDSDWAGMAHSLEIRVPLVDVALLRAVAPMVVGPTPPTKLDMAASPNSPLPASVLNRPKTGFSVPVRQWLMEIAQPSTSDLRSSNSQLLPAERGLRGWTRYVYQRFAGTDMLVKQGTGRRGHGTRNKRSSLPAPCSQRDIPSPPRRGLELSGRQRKEFGEAEGASRRVSGASESLGQGEVSTPPPISSLPAPSRPPPAPRSDLQSPSPLRLDRGLELPGRRRKEFGEAEGAARRVSGASESLGQGEVSTPPPTSPLPAPSRPPPAPRSDLQSPSPLRLDRGEGQGEVSTPLPTSPLPAPCSLLPASLRVLVLASDAFGGHGGIAKFNRDLLSSLSADPAVREVIALPRLVPGDTGELPAKLRYDTSGVGGKLRYIFAVLKAARQLSTGTALPAPRSLPLALTAPNSALPAPCSLPLALPTPTSTLLAPCSLPLALPTPTSPLLAPCSLLLVCGHINLLPIAWLAQRLMRKAESRKQKAEIRSRETAQSPVSHLPSSASSPSLPAPRSLLPAAKPCSLLLVVHGIDAWQPTRSWLVNRLVRKIDAFISVSEFTKRRFLSWAKLHGVPGFILPNCIDLAQFKPGPKNPQLLQRYGLPGRTVLLTVARLSAQERYKGIDEVLEVLPELARQIPNLTYLIVGDGNDRARLEQKARSLGLSLAHPAPCPPPPAPRSQPPAPCSLPPAAQVLFTGLIPESEKVDHYRLADAFVMPGWGEGFGIAYLEAMACGVPVVGSQLDASQEALRHGALGIVVNPKVPGEIQRGILAALKRDREVVPSGLEHFSSENFEKRVHRILESVVRSP